MIPRLGAKLDFLTAADAVGMKKAVMALTVPALGASVPGMDLSAKQQPTHGLA